MPAIQYAAATDPGAVRDLNQDAVLAASPLFVVADGMGGHAAGEVAANLAVEQLSRLAGTADVHAEQIVAAVEAANRAILEWSADRPETSGMGTTLSGVCLGEVGGSPHWFVFNIGDSRVYRYAHGTLAQVTTDHSEVEELVAAGQISSDEARLHPRRNVVTRSLGTDPPPVPDVWVLPAEAGETFLVCSDGLPLEVSDEQITAVLAAARTPQDAADALIAIAVAAGGRDNISAVVVTMPSSAEPPAAEVSTAPRKDLAREAQ